MPYNMRLPHNHNHSFTGLVLLTAMYHQVVPAQEVAASNGTHDILPYNSSPRFFLNASTWWWERPYATAGSLAAVPVAPLGPYAQGYTRREFLQPTDDALSFFFLNTTADVGQIAQSSLVCMSCDPAAYAGSHLTSTDLFQRVLANQQLVWLVLYSEHADHCNVSNIDGLRRIGAILTTVGSSQGARLARYIQNATNPTSVEIFPDPNSFTDSSQSDNGNGIGLLRAGPAQSINSPAFIVLYVLVGVAVLLAIPIVAGIFRATRHPERYGPGLMVGDEPQSRTKGIARAVLETLPIIRFSELDKATVNRADEEDSVQLEPVSHAVERRETIPPTTSYKNTPVSQPSPETQSFNAAPPPPPPPPPLPRLTSQDSVKTTTPSDLIPNTADDKLSCCICTEDFDPTESVRVLPCRHFFHPACVDPWLLNVRGTCPMCRVDLEPEQGQPKENEEHESR